MVTRPRTVHKGGFLEERAREVFEDLGYIVSAEGGTLRAERGDKVVEVAVITGDSYDLCPYQWEDDKYCFVADIDEASDYHADVHRLVPPDSDWALIGVDNDTHQVV